MKMNGIWDMNAYSTELADEWNSLCYHRTLPALRTIQHVSPY